LHIDTRALDRLDPYVTHALDMQQPEVAAEVRRFALERSLRLNVEMPDDDAPRIVVAVIDDIGRYVALARLPAHAIGLHRVDDELIYLPDPILDEPDERDESDEPDERG
jgi:hypothetical protein